MIKSFNIYFYLFFMKLSWSHYSSHEFYMLILIDPINLIYYCFNIFLKNYSLKCFLIKLCFFMVIQVAFDVAKLKTLYQINLYIV